MEHTIFQSRCIYLVSDKRTDLDHTCFLGMQGISKTKIYSHIAPTIQGVRGDFSGAETEAMLLQLTRDVTPAVRGAAVSALGECPPPALWKVIWRDFSTQEIPVETILKKEGWCEMCHVLLEMLSPTTKSTWIWIGLNFVYRGVSRLFGWSVDHVWFIDAGIWEAIISTSIRQLGKCWWC